jgi:hypothetical protein
MRLSTIVPAIVPTRVRLAEILGITRAALHLWGVEWDVTKSDRVIGALLRVGLIDETIARAAMVDFDVAHLVERRVKRIKRRAADKRRRIKIREGTSHGA